MRPDVIFADFTGLLSKAFAARCPTERKIDRRGVSEIGIRYKNTGVPEVYIRVRRTDLIWLKCHSWPGSSADGNSISFREIRRPAKG